MSRLVGLYPSDWRVRYEGEFLALLEERPPSIRDQFDIARSAIDAHLHPQVNRPQRIRDRYGLGPLAGFGLFALAVFLMATGPVQFDEYGIYRDGSAAFLPLIVAAALLSVGLYRIVDRLPAGAKGSRVAGWLAIGAGLGWISIPWLLPVGLVFLLAVLGLAAGARRLGIWPTWSFVVLVAALVVPAGLIAAQTVPALVCVPGRGSRLPDHLRPAQRNVADRRQRPPAGLARSATRDATHRTDGPGPGSGWLTWAPE